MKNKIESKNLQLLDDGTKVQGKTSKAADYLKKLLSSCFNSMHYCGIRFYPKMNMGEAKTISVTEKSDCKPVKNSSIRILRRKIIIAFKAFWDEIKYVEALVYKKNYYFGDTGKGNKS